MDFEETNGRALTDEQIDYLDKLAKAINVVLDECREPVDTKVIGLLEIAHDIVVQQAQLDVYYEWDYVASSGTKAEEPPSPSADDLNRWFGDFNDGTDSE